MSPIEEALWYIEAHLTQDLTLADIAASACVSRHPLVQAFGAAMGVADPDGNVLELFGL